MGDTLCAICSYIGQDLKSSDCAAWVQAFGAILAVVAAFLVAYLQNRYEKCREKAKAKERVTDVITTTIHLAGGALKVDGELNKMCAAGSASNSDLELMAIEMESINRALRGVPIWELQIFDVVENIVAIQSLSATLEGLVKKVKTINVSGNYWASQVGNQLIGISPDLKKRVGALIAIEGVRKRG
jgi:hypothetical protein